MYLLILASALSTLSFADGIEISDVKISHAFFNPSTGEKVQISFKSPFKGSLSCLILDRDGYVIHKLANVQSVEKGPITLTWDGRNDKGVVVPDEAYSLKIEIISGKKSVTYFPAAVQLKQVQAELIYYDRQNRIIKYNLPKPSRVHAHAGSAILDHKTKQSIGPVLKTLVNREPRIAGSVVEHWSGYDESGTIYVPDLPNFAFSFSVSELPENSMICTGNKSVTFLDTIRKRTGSPQLQPVDGDHPHHRDLSTLDDVSPVMKLKPINATWSDKESAWVVTEGVLRLEGNLEGPSAQRFSKLPGSMGIFLNNKQVWSTDKPKASFQSSIALDTLPDGMHYVAINWGTQYGPLVANAFQIKVQKRKDQ